MIFLINVYKEGKSAVRNKILTKKLLTTVTKKRNNNEMAFNTYKKYFLIQPIK